MQTQTFIDKADIGSNNRFYRSMGGGVTTTLKDLFRNATGLPALNRRRIVRVTIIVQDLVGSVLLRRGTYSQALATLHAECPAYVDAADWQQAIEDGYRFVTQWAKQAEALGWAPADLFGLHTPPEKPAPNYRRPSRYDWTGLIWLLHGRPVVALTETEATILAPSGANLTYRMSLATEIANGPA